MISNIASFLCYPCETLDSDSDKDRKEATEFFKKYCIDSLIGKVIEFASTYEALAPEDDETYISNISGALLFFDMRLKSLNIITDSDSIIRLTNSKRVRSRFKARTKLLAYARKTLISNNQNTVPIYLKGNKSILTHFLLILFVNTKLFFVAGSLDNLHPKRQSTDTDNDDTKAVVIDDGNSPKEFIPLGLPPLKLHVSIQTYNLVQTIIQKLREVSDSSDERLLSLPMQQLKKHVLMSFLLISITISSRRKIQAFYATNDLIDIFRCFLPISYEQNLAENPTRAMLFYNDCEYLAYILMDLNHEVSKSIPAPLSRVASYLDSMPLIRRSGENALLILMVLTQVYESSFSVVLYRYFRFHILTGLSHIILI